MSKILLSGVTIGTFAGAFLLLVCAYVEMITPIELMTLLLNVDFIYDDLNIVIEILLHLAVSILIASVMKTLQIYKEEWYKPVMIIIFLITAGLYFILQEVAIKEIHLEGYIGFILWTILHVGYFEILYYMHKHQY